MEQDFKQIESSQRQHHEVLAQEERMYALVQESEYKLFAMLQPKIYKDGNQWCVLYGEDLQSGIAGFGDTPYKAILDWNKQWDKQ